MRFGIFRLHYDVEQNDVQTLATARAILQVPGVWRAGQSHAQASLTRQPNRKAWRKSG